MSGRWRVVVAAAVLWAASPALAGLEAPAEDPICEDRTATLERAEGLSALFDEASGPLRLFLEKTGLDRGMRRFVKRVERRYVRDCVALNQVQVMGSHNSYHIEPPQDLIDFYLAFDPAAPELQYTHRPLGEQFAELGIRQIELDVFHDPEGGRYASPLGLQILDENPDVRIPELEEPGIKVMHIQEIDWNTTCWLLVDCLKAIRKWSKKNPDHLPLMVLIEAKQDPFEVPPILGLELAVPLPWDADAFDELDATIRSVFKPKQLITPDDVRGEATTLEEAVLSDGWPRLGEARGKVLFALDNVGATRDAYRNGRTNLEGRVLFVDGTPGEPDAAFVKVNGPLGNEDLIRDLVDQGYIVRTRADAGTIQSREDDPTQRESALSSGAQYVSTDYPEPDLRFSDYRVEIPDGAPGRCNPVNGPPGCRSRALEK